MALRLVEALVPKDAEGRLEQALKDQPVLDTWHAPATHDRISVRILIEANQADGVLNVLEKECGGLEGFRVTLVAVEATIPREPEEEDEGQEGEEEGEESHSTRVGVEELYEDVADLLGSGRVFFVLLTVSAIVAAVGLYRGDVAIIVGAMVIAPLLGPSVAVSLATTMADFNLAGRAVTRGTLGLLLVIALSAVIGRLVPVDLDAMPQIASRTDAAVSDIALALAAGAAGALSISTGVPTALMGVMVAVALLPPLVVVGLLLGSGFYTDAFGAGLLLAIYLVCINLSGVVTFLVQGVRPRLGWAAGAVRRSTVAAIILWTVLLAALAVLLWLTEAFPM